MFIFSFYGCENNQTDNVLQDNDYMENNVSTQTPSYFIAEYFAETGSDIFSLNRIPNSNYFLVCFRNNLESENNFNFYMFDDEFRNKKFLFSSEQTDLSAFCDGNDGFYFVNNNIARFFQEGNLVWEKNIPIQSSCRILCNNDKGYIWQDNLMNLCYTTWNQTQEEILWSATYQKNTTKFPDTDKSGNIVATWSDKAVFSDDGKSLLLKEYHGEYFFKVILYDLESQHWFKSEESFQHGKIFFSKNIPWLFNYATNENEVSKNNICISSMDLTKRKEYESPIKYEDAYPGKEAVLLIGSDNNLYYLDSDLKKYEEVCSLENNSILLNAVSNNKITLLHLCPQPGKWIVQIFKNPW